MPQPLDLKNEYSPPQSQAFGFSVLELNEETGSQEIFRGHVKEDWS